MVLFDRDDLSRHMSVCQRQKTKIWRKYRRHMGSQGVVSRDGFGPPDGGPKRAPAQAFGFGHAINPEGGLASRFLAPARSSPQGEFGFGQWRRATVTECGKNRDGGRGSAYHYPLPHTRGHSPPQLRRQLPVPSIKRRAGGRQVGTPTILAGGPSLQQYNAAGLFVSVGRESEEIHTGGHALTRLIRPVPGHRMNACREVRVRCQYPHHATGDVENAQ